jgi:osmotically-inducible protein OsmY
MMTRNTLSEDLERELRWDPMVEAANIGVRVMDGAVTLTGYVPTYSEERAAVRAAERVYGVSSVADEINVRLSDTDNLEDSAVSEAIQQRFDWSVRIPKSVKAEVRDGYVTLRGDVDWCYQRQEAETVVRDVKGVKGVVNEIVVKPQKKSADIERDVSSALERNAELDARSIWVTTDDGTVHLHGHAHSFHERAAAELAASAARGVVAVDNQITVNP